MKKVLIVVAVLATLFGLHKLTESQERYDCNGAVITVGAGNTLWGIASANCKGNIQAVVDHLVNEYGSTVEPGQKIQLP